MISMAMTIWTASMLTASVVTAAKQYVASPWGVTFSWTGARDWCQSQGLTMASIHSEADNAAAFEECPGNCWIGLNCIGMSHGDFSWTDGSEWSYTKWQSGQPDDNHGHSNPDEDCVCMYGGDSWFDGDCNYPLSALCNKESSPDIGAELGCFKDTEAQWVSDVEWALSHWTGLRLTVADCLQLCSDEEYSYFALQYGQGTEVGSCFCGNSYAEATRYGPADNCEAGTGGAFSNSLYRIKETSAPTTSPTPSPTLSTLSPTPSPTPLPTPAGLEEEGFVLIQQHRDVANGYFSSSVSWSGVENEHDPEANTFCIIGNIDPADYRLNDGRFWLKLIYRYDDGTVDTLEWTQTSWITDSVITGADLFGVVDDGIVDQTEFQGLTKTPRTVYHGSYLDGTDSIPVGWHYSFWYHAIACWDGQNGGIPAHNGKFAKSSSLWIKQLERAPL